MVRAIRALGVLRAGRPGRSFGFARNAKGKLATAFSLSFGGGCHQAGTSGLTALHVRAAGAGVPECRGCMDQEPGGNRSGGRRVETASWECLGAIAKLRWGL